jgi:hypothetical protein
MGGTFALGNGWHFSVRQMMRGSSADARRAPTIELAPNSAAAQVTDEPSKFPAMISGAPHEIAVTDAPNDACRE